MQTESEDIGDDSHHSSSKETASLNEKIHQRIKQLLGNNYSRIKSEKFDTETKNQIESKVISEKPGKSGRGKWHYACDQKYGFNVSYSNGDTIISMG